MSLDGKHAVVTGGSQGIGKAIAQTLSEHGANVTIMSRTRETLVQTAQELHVNFVVCDATIPDSVASAFAECAAVDILVNNVGNALSAPFHRTDFALWQKMFNLNLTSTYLCTQAVVPGMVARGDGRIINIASTAALTGYAYVTAYCAAKHAVLGFTRALALELAQKGVTVNAICPGYTDTPMLEESLARIVEKTGRGEEHALAELVRGIPQGRLIQPQEIAYSALWLCQAQSAAITGQAIAIAGGEVL